MLREDFLAALPSDFFAASDAYSGGSRVDFAARSQHRAGGPPTAQVLGELLRAQRGFARRWLA